MLNYYVDTGGPGFPLILLHGNGEDGSYFHNQIDYFRRRRRVIAIDSRGHGRTPRGDSPLSLYRFADDLYAFMTGTGIMKADILGFSDGANVAMIFALAHQDMIGRLILNGGNLDPSGVKRSVQWPIVAGYRIASLFARRNPEAALHAEMLSLMVNEPHIRPEELASLKLPVLVIAGSRDMIKARHTRLIHDSIPGSVLRIIPGNHFIAARNSGDFNRAVEDFLVQNPRLSSDGTCRQQQ